MRYHTRAAVLATAVGVALLTACSDATSPKPGQFNTSRVEAGVATVQRAAGSSVLGSLQAMARAAAAVGSTAQAGSVTAWDGGLGDAIQRLANATTQTGAALIPVIRQSVLGQTFVYDAGTRTYVADPKRTGAPPNGVRFVLYETATNGDPNPGREIGYAELTDERRTSPSTAGVRLVVVTDGVTRLSYAFDLSGSLDAAQFHVQGFLSDGTDRVEFDITTSQQLFGRAGPATLDATLTVPQHDFVVTAKAQGTSGQPAGDGSVNVAVRSGSDAIDIIAKTMEGQLDATFTVNGQLLATASGDPKAPVIRGEGGRELTADETHALSALVGMAGNLLAFISALLQPAGVLLLVALGLGG